ncbi:MAG: SDR family oxidoreductase [Acidobacteriota bacterium]
MGKLDGKVVLITGANRGIGRGIAEAFASEGASLILMARDNERLQQTAEALTKLGSEVLAIAGDVTNEEQVQDIFQKGIERFNRLDILVNNAGTMEGFAPIDQLTLEMWEKVMAVNLRGAFLCTREALRIMKAQGSGRIINIGSISAQRVRPNSAAYSTTKHGLWGLTQVTALEGREYGISCGCLHPGNVAVEKRQGDSEPMMSESEIAQAALAMATLPPHINMLEAIVLPVGQLYIGRG